MNVTSSVENINMTSVVS